MVLSKIFSKKTEQVTIEFDSIKFEQKGGEAEVRFYKDGNLLFSNSTACSIYDVITLSELEGRASFTLTKD